MTKQGKAIVGTIAAVLLVIIFVPIYMVYHYWQRPKPMATPVAGGISSNYFLIVPIKTNEGMTVSLTGTGMVFKPLANVVIDTNVPTTVSTSATPAIVVATPPALPSRVAVKAEEKTLAKTNELLMSVEKTPDKKLVIIFTETNEVERAKQLKAFAEATLPRDGALELERERVLQERLERLKRIAEQSHSHPKEVLPPRPLQVTNVMTTYFDAETPMGDYRFTVTDELITSDHRKVPPPRRLIYPFDPNRRFDRALHCIERVTRKTSLTRSPTYSVPRTRPALAQSPLTKVPKPSGSAFTYSPNYYQPEPGGHSFAWSPNYAEGQPGVSDARSPGYDVGSGGSPFASGPGYAEGPTGNPFARGPSLGIGPQGNPIARGPGYSEGPRGNSLARVPGVGPPPLGNSTARGPEMGPGPQGNPIARGPLTSERRGGGSISREPSYSESSRGNPHSQGPAYTSPQHGNSTVEAPSYNDREGGAGDVVEGPGTSVPPDENSVSNSPGYSEADGGHNSTGGPQYDTPDDTDSVTRAPRLEQGQKGDDSVPSPQTSVPIPHRSRVPAPAIVSGSRGKSGTSGPNSGVKGDSSALARTPNYRTPTAHSGSPPQEEPKVGKGESPPPIFKF